MQANNNNNNNNNSCTPFFAVYSVTLVGRNPISVWFVNQGSLETSIPLDSDRMKNSFAVWVFLGKEKAGEKALFRLRVLQKQRADGTSSTDTSPSVLVMRTSLPSRICFPRFSLFLPYGLQCNIFPWNSIFLMQHQFSRSAIK
jgi:hypothetical protein